MKEQREVWVGSDPQQCGVTLRPETGFFDLGVEDAFR